MVKSIVYDVQKPFDLILNNVDSQLWQPLIESFSKHFIKFDFTFQLIKTVVESLGIEFEGPKDNRKNSK